MLTREKYMTLSVPVLRGLAKSRGIKNTSVMKKSALAEAMLELDEQQEELPEEGTLSGEQAEPENGMAVREEPEFRTAGQEEETVPAEPTEHTELTEQAEELHETAKKPQQPRSARTGRKTPPRKNPAKERQNKKRIPAEAGKTSQEAPEKGGLTETAETNKEPEEYKTPEKTDKPEAFEKAEAPEKTIPSETAGIPEKNESQRLCD